MCWTYCVFFVFPGSGFGKRAEASQGIERITEKTSKYRFLTILYKYNKSIDLLVYEFMLFNAVVFHIILP